MSAAERQHMNQGAQVANMRFEKDRPRKVREQQTLVLGSTTIPPAHGTIETTSESSIGSIRLACGPTRNQPILLVSATVRWRFPSEGPGGVRTCIGSLRSLRSSLISNSKQPSGMMTSAQRPHEVRPRKDHRGVDLISDELPFGRLWYGEANAVANAVGYANSYRPAGRQGRSGCGVR
jgi:hypothetical protein